MSHQVVLSVPPEIEYSMKVAGSFAKDILTCPGMVLPVGLARIEVMKSDMSSPFASVLEMYRLDAVSWLVMSSSLKLPEPGSVAVVDVPSKVYSKH